jgi:hypothetical protein
MKSLSARAAAVHIPAGIDSSRMMDIDANRIIVTPAPGQPARMLLQRKESAEVLSSALLWTVPGVSWKPDDLPEP